MRINFENHTLDVLPNNYKNKPPCLNCAKRMAGCHTFCALYKDYKEKFEEEKQEIKKKKDYQSELVNTYNNLKYRKV